jgi:hypothetical protein
MASSAAEMEACDAGVNLKTLFLLMKFCLLCWNAQELNGS